MSDNRSDFERTRQRENQNIVRDIIGNFESEVRESRNNRNDTLVEAQKNEDLKSLQNAWIREKNVPDILPMQMSMSMTSGTTSTSMSGMDMGAMSSYPTSTSTSSMDMSGMNMASTASSASSSSTSTSGMNMDMGSSSDSASSMSMTMWMTTSYKGTSVFFRTLDAHSGAAAFGIFCVLFFTSFFFRGLIFLSSYLEQAVFHNYSNTIRVEEDCECGDVDDKASPPPSAEIQHPPLGTIIRKLFWMGPKELMHDVIRLLLSFTIVMFGYAIMLASMSFVILYFFAICLGLSFAEIFFNRLAIILNINKSFGACAGMH
ncbi:hypothetical protein C6P42_001909 [Pichia californica]|nr:hypothetical protein C6P42_001909 [[Candida] californica]